LSTKDVQGLVEQAVRKVDRDSEALLVDWPKTKDDYTGDELVVHIRDKELRTPLVRETLSGSKIPRVSLPRFDDDGEVLRFLRKENLPGRFPFTAGVFPFKRTARTRRGCSPVRATRSAPTVVSSTSPAGSEATSCPPPSTRSRSTVATRTLRRTYTQNRHVRCVDRDPGRHEGAVRRLRPDVADTSVSMTINGPAPTILAYFLNTAIDPARGRLPCRARP